LHDAALAISQIMIEVTVALILLLASRRLPQEISTRDERQ
jgi:hypothetical protein